MNCSSAARADGRTLFMPYVTGGYPRREDTVPILLAMEAGGADVIELGVPFTDPAGRWRHHSACEPGCARTGYHARLLLRFRRRGSPPGAEAPVLFMGYYNPILARGEARAVEDAAACWRRTASSSWTSRRTRRASFIAAAGQRYELRSAHRADRPAKSEWLAAPPRAMPSSIA